MKDTRPAVLLLLPLLVGMVACRKPLPEVLVVNAPDGQLSVSFFLTKTKAPAYRVKYEGEVVIDTSTLGFVLKDAPPLQTDLKIVSIQRKAVNENWYPVWGRNDTIDNHYNELKIRLQEVGALRRLFDVVFKVYDDGLGFRYEFLEQEHLTKVTIMEEMTKFHLTDDHTAWWIPADYDSYEYLYTQSKLSEINAYDAGYKERHDRHVGNIKAANTPLTMRTKTGLYLSFHEANLTNYAGMTLGVTPDNTLQSELVPAPDGSKVSIETPFVTPWRTIQIGRKAGDLISSNLIVNLNEPGRIKDVSWIKPMKYNGIWWAMHIGKSSWDYGTEKHGATTENVQKYMDFAARNNIRGTLVEGWNPGWENWGNKQFELMKTYPDFDIKKVVAYGQKIGVNLIGHHETFGNIRYYDSIVEKAFQYYHQVGVHYVKTGYAAGLLPKQYHHSQAMVNHYRKVLEMAAKYHICLDVHEPIKPTGIRRTYPNMMTREGVRGMEYNAWGGGNPPDHTTIIPFTRGLAGPVDYTPGIFDIKFEAYRKDQYVRSTLAKQLALYVVLYSPMQMVADLPEHYQNQPALDFIKTVGVNWSESIVLNGEIGQYISIARKEKETGNWFLGSITNEAPRDLCLPLDFLDADMKYEAVIYVDAKTAHWEKNPTAYLIQKKMVSKDSTLCVQLAAGGGCAIAISKQP